MSVFIDSNIALYLLCDDVAKANRCEELLRTRPVISVQVLNEVTHVCVRKHGMAWDDIAQFLTLIRRFCTVVPVSVEVHDRARQLAQRHKLAFYDACIVAAAALAGCQTLYSEDMHHGLVIDGGLTLRNPFI